MNDFIKVRGARQHNLKNIDLDIPKNKLIVITGPSGSGKSSLAFDTIYAEGQRRYVESLSSYARQFLDIMEKPDVDVIEGLSPAIAIDQKTTSKNPRSTVGTVTEIYDYMRVLWANIGKSHCPICGRTLEGLSAHQILERVYERYKDKKILILSPIVRGKKGEFRNIPKDVEKLGYSRVYIDKEIKKLIDFRPLDKNKKHDIDIVIDLLELTQEERPRALLSIEKALSLSKGLVRVIEQSSKDEEIFSESLTCPDHGFSLPEISPRIFSFNSPYGACELCKGLGIKWEVDEKLLLNEDEPLPKAIRILEESKSFYYLGFSIRNVLRKLNEKESLPFKKIKKEVREIILYGTRGKYPFEFEGIIPYLERVYLEGSSERDKELISNFIKEKVCPSCKGARLNQGSLSVLVNKKNIWEVSSLSIEKAFEFFDELPLFLTPLELQISSRLIKEIKDRLSFLKDVGLEYLTLSRSASSLSGGEMQRIRLATQLGSKLSGILYVLDEPSIGLHPRDTTKLINTLKNLRDLGNTVIVVEHDFETIINADYLIELGPGAGKNGGNIVFIGTVDEAKKSDNSLTGAYLSGTKKIEVPKERRKPQGFIEIIGASENNLKNINVKIPTGCFVCITGVSGSGKSTLIYDILWRYAKDKFYSSKEEIGKVKDITGLEAFDKVINVDQSPIGRTPRSNPATYTKVFDLIRDLFAELPESKARGYKSGRFSFNVPGGRCEACQGEGYKMIEMHFLPPVYITCDVCKGKRYNKETLDIFYKGKNIADILDMTVKEAISFFENVPSIHRKLSLLEEVGLDYITLGQSATTLSGGEAQRIKLAKELSKKDTGKTLYLLDEPTTGLHADDVKKLIKVLQKLVDKKNTVIVIEHNLDVIKSADYIIDLGPEGGEKGGYVVAAGSPEDIMSNEKSYTAKYLREYINSF